MKFVFLILLLISETVLSQPFIAPQRDVQVGRDADGVEYKEKRTSGVNSANSTSTLLGADEEFTGAWVDVSDYSTVSVTVKSDQSSATDGLIIELSTDGSSVTLSDEYTIAANMGEQYTVGITAQYFRVRYVNGSTPQASFQLQTILHTGKPKSSSHRISDAIDGENDAELVKSVTTGKNPDDVFVNVRIDGRKSAFSSLVPLGVGESFVSPIVETSSYLTIDFTVTSDVVSATDGIVLDWFSDSAGSNLIKQSTFTYSTPGQGAFFNVPMQSAYVRLTYTNNSTAQTAFILDTRFRASPNVGLLSQVESNLTGDLLATLSRSILFGRTENGGLQNVELSNSNSLKVAVTDRPSEVRDRTRIVLPILRSSLSTTTPTVIHTVTPGNTFYVSSFLISSLNASASSGQFRLRDGATIISEFLVIARESGSTPSTTSLASPTLPEPIPFTTNLNFLGVAGSIEVAGYVIGYEEPN